MRIRRILITCEHTRTENFQILVKLWNKSSSGLYPMTAKWQQQSRIEQNITQQNRTQQKTSQLALIQEAPIVSILHYSLWIFTSNSLLYTKLELTFSPFLSPSLAFCCLLYYCYWLHCREARVELDIRDFMSVLWACTKVKVSTAQYRRADMRAFCTVAWVILYCSALVEMPVILFCVVVFSSIGEDVMCKGWVTRRNEWETKWYSEAEKSV
jgi:hypothetical protein